MATLCAIAALHELMKRKNYIIAVMSYKQWTTTPNLLLIIYHHHYQICCRFVHGRPANHFNTETTFPCLIQFVFKDSFIQPSLCASVQHSLYPLSHRWDPTLSRFKHHPEEFKMLMTMIFISRHDRLLVYNLTWTLPKGQSRCSDRTRTWLSALYTVSSPTTLKHHYYMIISKVHCWKSCFKTHFVCTPHHSGVGIHTPRLQETGATEGHKYTQWGLWSWTSAMSAGEQHKCRDTADFFQMRNFEDFTRLKYEKRAPHHFIKIPDAQVIERKLEHSVARFMVELWYRPRDIPLAHVIFSLY